MGWQFQGNLHQHDFLSHTKERILRLHGNLSGAFLRPARRAHAHGPTPAPQRPEGGGGPRRQVLSVGEEHYPGAATNIETNEETIFILIVLRKQKVDFGLFLIYHCTHQSNISQLILFLL